MSFTEVDAKALKKQRKQEKKAAKAAAAESASTATSEASDAKAIKKAKKKAKKAAKAAAEAAATTSPSKKKSKDKKRKRDSTEEAKTDAEEPVSSPKAAVNNPYQQPNPSSFKKSFYHQSAETASQSAEAVTEFYQKNEMSISGTNCNYNPIMKFAHAPFPSNIMKSCAGYTTPTPIQSQCWPILTSGRDIIGIAQTGSGKTIAFTLPGLVHLLDQPAVSFKNQGPIMLVVAPTRELALQSSEVITKAGAACSVKSTCIFGGVPKYEQRKALKSGVHVVVATPGRLQDLVEDGSCSLSRVTYLVLDEADRLLDEGFEKPIRAIIGAANSERQIAMFSATWPDSVKQLAHEFLSDAVKVTCGSEDLVANRNIKQIVEVVEPHVRDHKIHGLLQNYHKSRKNRVLVFVLYKKEAVRVERMLQQRGWNCTAIHGDKAQDQRMKAVEKFKSGEIPLLIATDVAARGLDIPDVEYVLNYAFPLTIEDYVHRIGRTGRGGAKGISHTFFTSFDKPRAGELVNLLRESSSNIPDALTKFGTHVKKKEHKLYGAFAKNVDMTKKATKITFD